MREVCCSIQWVDIPTVVATGVPEAFFFAEDVVTGKLLANTLPNERFRFLVGDSYEIGFAFVFDLDVLVEMLHEQRARFSGNCSDARDEFEV